jgi:type VI secretion system protein VasD
MSIHPTKPAGVLAIGVFLSLAIFLTGCAGPQAKPPTVAEIRFVAVPNLNPGITGDAAPLVVRVYELAASGAFSNSDFFALFDGDQGALGADMLGRDELRLIPGAQQSFKKTLQPGTRHLGIMAAYREIDQVRWRQVVPVKPEKINKFTVSLGEKALSVSPN